MKPTIPAFWMSYISVVFAVLDNALSVDVMPIFDVSPINVTAIAGSTAVLPCSVQNVGNYQIVWLNPRKILIAMEDRRTMDDTRLSIERPQIPDWNLHIRSVRYADRGMYACTLNTDPVGVRRIYLSVLVPPDINELLSSGKQIVKEGATVRLHCNASGKPEPNITWFRKTIYDKGETKYAIKNPGETLIIHNISRFCDGIYECVASNGVSEDVSKEIQVEVHYKPEVTVLNKKIKQAKGRETILQCHITASPLGEGFWQRGHDIITPKATSRLRVEAYQDQPKMLILDLKIMDIQEKDFGEYTCLAKNKWGRDSESMYLYELTDEVTTIEPSTPGRSWKTNYSQVVRRPATTPLNPIYGVKGSDMLGMGYSAAGNSASGSLRILRILWHETELVPFTETLFTSLITCFSFKILF